MPHPWVLLTNWTDRIGFCASTSSCQLRPPSMVPSTSCRQTTHPVVVLMKFRPTYSLVDEYCLLQCVPSLVVKMAPDPTAQPTRGVNIWMAASAGMKAGSVPSVVAVGGGLGVGWAYGFVASVGGVGRGGGGVGVAGGG